MVSLFDGVAGNGNWLFLAVRELTFICLAHLVDAAYLQRTSNLTRETRRFPNNPLIPMLAQRLESKQLVKAVGMIALASEPVPGVPLN